MNDKTIIVIEVYPSRNTPHYIKSKGIVEGTYIHVGATSRPADEIKLKEL